MPLINEGCNLLNKIKIAIICIGNCCSSLYQRLHYYKDNNLSGGIIKN